jgi:hypothetical protein
MATLVLRNDRGSADRLDRAIAHRRHRIAFEKRSRLSLGINLDSRSDNHRFSLCLTDALHACALAVKRVDLVVNLVIRAIWR